MSGNKLNNDNVTSWDILLNESFKVKGQELCYLIKVLSLNAEKYKYCTNKSEGASGAIKDEMNNGIKANQYKPTYAQMLCNKLPRAAETCNCPNRTLGIHKVEWCENMIDVRTGYITPENVFLKTIT